MLIRLFCRANTLRARGSACSSWMVGLAGIAAAKHNTKQCTERQG